MAEASLSFPKAFAVSFSEVKRWDPNSFHTIEWHWPSSVMDPIGSVLTHRKEKVNRTDNGFSDLMPITIHFDGSIEPRKVNQSKEYTMDLFWARPGDIVVSKIDLKNGAVAIIPDGWNKVVVTNHFAVYKPNLERIDPQYFHLLIQSKLLKEHLWRNKVGAEGRKEVKLDFFESLSIPIPQLFIQKRIVDYWNETMREKEAEQQSVELETGAITNKLLCSAGIEINIQNRLPRLSIKRFQHFERWGVEFNRHSWDLSNLMISKAYQCSPISDYAWVNPSTEIEFSEDTLVTFIPMAAVDEKDGLVVSPETRKFKQVKTGYTRFMENDVLWAKITPCMQNGKSAIAKNLLNKIGFGSTEFHVIRTKKQSDLMNEYLHLILRLPEIRQAAMRFFVGSAGQQRVPKEFLEGLYIPVPPIELQLEIIKKVKIGRKNIFEIRSRLVNQKILSQKCLEKLIIGSLSE